MHFSDLKTVDTTRHVLGLSGGKDSAALAIYIRDKYPELSAKMEYFFTDTGSEMKEVYEFLDSMEAFLDTKIHRLSSGKPFEHWLKVHNNYLPSAKQRWCTRTMKIQPFEQFINDDDVISYVGIRADENRQGYESSKETIRPVFPFVEDGIMRADVFQILDKSVGVPKYYNWRSRSGCYFCFFQRQDEWLWLKRIHPDLFKQSQAFEDNEGDGFTWRQEGTLNDVVAKAELAEKFKIRKQVYEEMESNDEDTSLYPDPKATYPQWRILDAEGGKQITTFTTKAEAEKYVADKGDSTMYITESKLKLLARSDYDETELGNQAQAIIDQMIKNQSNQIASDRSSKIQRWQDIIDQEEDEDDDLERPCFTCSL